jgi:hypothetical protein
MSSPSIQPSPPPIVGRALLVSSDSAAVRQLITYLQQFAIISEVCADLATATTLINTRKFEAIFLDLALGEQVSRVLERIRLSPANRNSVTFALADPTTPADYRVQLNFAIQKPLTGTLVKSTLRAALGLIIRDYRRYFRCPVNVPVVIHIDGRAKIPCAMVNISEGGLAFTTLVTLKPGALVKAEFALPDERTAFDIDSEVCWCDNKGRAGLQFRSVSAAQRLLLQEWLSQRIERGLPEPVARLFQRSQ